MTRAELAAGGVTLPLVIVLTVAVDAAVGFAGGVAAFPGLVRIAHAAGAHAAHRSARTRRGARDARFAGSRG